MTRKIRLGEGFELDEHAVTTSFALLAMKGAGKSNAAVVFAERLFDAGIPWVAIDPKGDWWGIRAGKAGLAVPIFGGLHADVPIDPAAGALFADLIVDQHLTALIDTSELSKRESIRFLEAFFDRLYRRKNRATYPMHLFLEECDDYVPQRVYADIARLVRQVELVVKRGRARCLGITLASQRAASINKDVLTQTDVLIALRNTSPQDRKAIEQWLSWHASSREIADQLPQLQAGEAWVNWPERGMLQAVKFDRRRTFDSGATPELGEKVKAATLADIDVEAITTAVASIVEKAEADDPKALRARIVELERKLAAAPTVETIFEVRNEIPEPLVLQLRENAENAERLASDLRRTFEDLPQERVKARAAKPGRASTWLDEIHAKTAGLAPRSTDGWEFFDETGARMSPAREAYDVPDLEPKLKAGARRMLGVLQDFDRPLTKAQLSVLAQVSKGGTFSDYLSSLRQGGYIVEDGDSIRIAPTHRVSMSGDRDLPTPEQIATMYRPRLKAGARRMLDCLMAAHPGGISRAELSEQAEVSKGGTFSDYLSSLVRVGLAVTHGQHVWAGETLYIGRS